jgi:nucleoside phosphorylase
MWPVCPHKAESGVDLSTCCLPISTHFLLIPQQLLSKTKTLSSYSFFPPSKDTMHTVKKFTHDDYTVAWIAPLEVESIAARLMLDTKHEKLPQSSVDHNVYILGSIDAHNIVIASLPTTGNTSAATVVTQLRNTFKQIRFGLLVGIGGGVPTRTDNGPIHLGDVVVSKPEQTHSGAIQYDHGKALEGHFRRTGCLTSPPTVLLNAARDLSIEQAITEDDLVARHLRKINTRLPALRKYRYPGSDQDYLYRSDYPHRIEGSSCRSCACDPSQRVDRHGDESQEDEIQYDRSSRIVVHRGTIAAGERVIRNSQLRDELAEAHGTLCFEMEAAGVMNDFPCLVIRGISDYADSHKNDGWHGYASASAAAYARQLFFHMPVDEVKQCAVGLAGI